MFSTNYFSNKVSYKLNKYGDNGIMVEQPIKEGEIICQFPVNNVIVMDIDIYNKLKKILGNIVPESDLLSFSLALHILYHPQKYQYVFEHIYQNYSPYKPFFFREEEMKLIKDTILYQLTQARKLHFNIMITKYIEIDSDITYASEQKLKLLFAYCSARSTYITIKDKSTQCLSPSALFNLSYSDKSYLDQTIDKGQWIIKANKDYQVGDEITSNIVKKYEMGHQNYPNLKLTDWKIPLMSVCGMNYNDEQFETEFGFNLDNNVVNEEKIKMIDTLYDRINIDEMKVEAYLIDDSDQTKIRHRECLKSIIDLIGVEKTYYQKFKSELQKSKNNEINLEIT